MTKEMLGTLLTDAGEQYAGTNRMSTCSADGVIDSTKATLLAMLCL